MDQKAIVKFCKEAGCCDACALRVLGLKSPHVYEDVQKFILNYRDEPTASEPAEQTQDNGSASPQAKRRRPDICATCLGVLQPATWPNSCQMVKEMLDKKQYESSTFACALSSPMAAILREKALALMLQEKFPQYDHRTLTPLKEAWKWSFGPKLAGHINRTLDSGAVSPLLITLNMEYQDDLQELEILKTLSASHFESRSRQRKRFTVEFTRRSVELALDGVARAALRALPGWEALPPAAGAVACVSVVCTHVPAYLGGRYVKLSRELPQTPWLVNGVRMMPSSVQEIIFAPLAKLYGMSAEEAESRLKFVSAGREDVDVRCLGAGRPFALEITDPHRVLSVAELRAACGDITRGGQVAVHTLVHVTREDLTELKKGEEMKCKTYEALCIKVSNSKGSDETITNGAAPPTVTPQDIEALNAYRNTPPGAAARILLAQKTPIRVLHRRPLLTRTRSIFELTASAVPDHPQLFVVRVRTEAGTYIKEWVHGELGRTAPALGAALGPGAAADILALDVASIDLDWPNKRD